MRGALHSQLWFGTIYKAVGFQGDQHSQWVMKFSFEMPRSTIKSTEYERSKVVKKMKELMRSMGTLIAVNPKENLKII